MRRDTRRVGSAAQRSWIAAAVAAVWLLACAARTASAQQPLPELSLEELIGIDSGRVFGASDRMQLVTEAPASVSFVTAEEIARQGYRSLAEILRGVRGLYVTNDRNFSFLGARGFGQPGDYNSRVLLLVNGHRVNDNVFGQAEIGPEFGMDPAMFERVEIIRGPASSLYGDSAFFAVVNVITKSGAAIEGGSLSVEGGTLGTGLIRASLGRHLPSGLDVALSGTVEGSRGIERLYFPAFDAPSTNNGIAKGLDGESVGEWYGQARAKNFTLTGAYGRRKRDVPTASFGTAFNEQGTRENTVDRHALVDLEYAKPVKNGKVSIRGAYDRFTYSGVYPFAPATDGDPISIAENAVLGHRWTATAKFIYPIPGRQVLTVGAEYIDNLAQNQSFGYRGDSSLVLDLKDSSQQSAVFAQDEVRLTDRFLVNLGVRHDHYETFDRVTPRLAFIASTSTAQSFKYLFGKAFRAPNAYETNEVYFGDRVRSLSPEDVDTHEVVWERYTNDWLRTSVAGYWYRADRLISLVPDAQAFLATTYVNEGTVRAKGLELEAQMRLPRGVQSVASYAVQRALNSDMNRELANSPRQTATFRVSVPGPRTSNFSGEVLVMGRRLTLAGQELGTTAVVNLGVTVPLSRSFSLFGNVRNALDLDYSDPASSAHIQDLIQQNGRTARVGLRWNLLHR